MTSFRTLAMAGVLLALTGCVTPAPYYRETHQEVVYRDGHYYATGNDRDGDYYYGREQPRYRYYDSYGGYGSGYWGLGRYGGCGYYGSCYGHGYGGYGYGGYGGGYWPQSSFSLSLGHSWNYGSLAWTGYWGGYGAYSGHHYRPDYRHYRRHDDHRGHGRYDRHDRDRHESGSDRHESGNDRHESGNDRRDRSRFQNRPQAQPALPPSRSEPMRYPVRADRTLSQPRLGEHRQARDQAIREPRTVTLLDREPRRESRFERSEPVQRAERPERFERREQAQPKPRPMPIRAISQDSGNDDSTGNARKEAKERDEREERGDRR